MSSPFKFGDFNFICERAALTICPLLGTAQGVMPTCYARNVQLGSQVWFQPGKSATGSYFGIIRENAQGERLQGERMFIVVLGGGISGRELGGSKKGNERRSDIIPKNDKSHGKARVRELQVRGEKRSNTGRRNCYRDLKDVSCVIAIPPFSSYLYRPFPLVIAQILC